MCTEIKATPYTTISKIGNSLTIVTANFLSALDSACLLYLLSSLLHQLVKKVLLPLWECNNSYYYRRWQACPVLQRKVVHLGPFIYMCRWSHHMVNLNANVSSVPVTCIHTYAKDCCHCFCLSAL